MGKEWLQKKKKWYKKKIPEVLHVPWLKKKSAKQFDKVEIKGYVHKTMSCLVLATIKNNMVNLWHLRIGHISKKWLIDIQTIRKNLIHFNHHFATTMQLLSKPTTFAIMIFIILCVHAASIYHYMCD
jgi:hypothetical protein